MNCSSEESDYSSDSSIDLFWLYDEEFPDLTIHENFSTFAERQSSNKLVQNDKELTDLFEKNCSYFNERLFFALIKRFFEINRFLFRQSSRTFNFIINLFKMILYILHGYKDIFINDENDKSNFNGFSKNKNILSSLELRTQRIVEVEETQTPSIFVHFENMIVRIKKHDEKLINRRNCIFELKDHFIQQAHKFSKNQNEIIYTFKRHLNEQNEKLLFCYNKLKDLVIEYLSSESLEMLQENEGLMKLHDDKEYFKKTDCIVEIEHKLQRQSKLLTLIFYLTHSLNKICFLRRNSLSDENLYLDKICQNISNVIDDIEARFNFLEEHMALTYPEDYVKNYPKQNICDKECQTDLELTNHHYFTSMVFFQEKKAMKKKIEELQQTIQKLGKEHTTNDILENQNLTTEQNNNYKNDNKIRRVNYDENNCSIYGKICFEQASETYED